ncbi:FAD-dependent oxidoreductase [Nocardia brasiliensis]|uniref:FAD-dependent oxidoreductase n=1 Tax=Nocardia brasiliensis TaxID=37326 RepID=UPI0024564C8A|nr:FAD-dependent monooxygenase [Nocardia brasiliensis]
MRKLDSVCPDVIVIGAGLGGLCLAQGLRRAGIGVAVYERDAAVAVRAQGHRLHLDWRGRRALAESLPPQLFSLIGAIAGRPAPLVHGFDAQLSPTGVFALDEPAPEQSAGAEVMPAHTVIDRRILRRILLSGLGGAVHFGRRCVGYVSENGSVTARFADGGQVRGTVLVAADGVGSAIRGVRLPQARVVDTRTRLIYGRVPLTPELRRALPPTMFSVFNSVVDPDRRFVGIAPVQYREPPATAAARLAPGLRLGAVTDTLAVLFGYHADRLPLGDNDLHSADGAQLRNLVLGQLSGWHPLVTCIVGSWIPSSVRPIVVRSSVPVVPWPSSTVTLLGDAIHAMSPAAGAGANMALRDAAALATALAAATDQDSLLDAIRDYERDMLDEGFAMVRLSAANGTKTLGADLLPS